MTRLKTTPYVLLMVAGLSLMMAGFYTGVAQAQNCGDALEACPTGSTTCNLTGEKGCFYSSDCVPKCGSASNCRCLRDWGRCTNNYLCYKAKCGDPFQGGYSPCVS